MIYLCLGILIGIAFATREKKPSKKMAEYAQKLITRETRLAYLYERMADSERAMQGVWNAGIPKMNEESQYRVQELFTQKGELIQELRDTHADFAEVYVMMRREFER